MSLFLQVFPEKSTGRLIGFFSFFLAVIFGFLYYNVSPTGDEQYYYNTAILIKKDFMSLFFSNRIGVLESFNAIIQGLLFMLPGNPFIKVFIVQAFIYSLTAYFIYKLSILMIGKTGAFIVIFLYLINHQHIAHVYSFKPGVWVTFFVTLLFYLAYKIFLSPDNKKTWIFMGITSAFLILTDLRYLPHIGTIYLLLFIFIVKRYSISKALVKTTYSILIFFILLLPWNIRNYFVFEKFVFVSDYNSAVAYRAVIPNYFQPWQKHLQGLSKLDDLTFEKRFWSICDSLKTTPGELILLHQEALKLTRNSTKIPIEEKYKELIDNKIFTADEIKLIIKKEENKPPIIKRLRMALFFWAPFNFKYFYGPYTLYKSFYPPLSLFINLNRIITLGILYPFLLFGFFMLFQRRNPFAFIFFITLMIHTFIHVYTFVQWRYLLPFLPIISIIAALGMKEIKTRICRNTINTYNTKYL